MRFDTKIAVVLRQDLQIWQKLNVTAFLMSAIATAEGAVGEPYQDGSGNPYLPMFRQPVMVFGASGAELHAAYERAMARRCRLAIFTEELFQTGHDEANRAAVRGSPPPSSSRSGWRCTTTAGRSTRC
jgi:hypothetical protein